MPASKILKTCLALAVVCLAEVKVKAAETIHDPIVVPGLAGKFSWLVIDPLRQRLVAAHRDTNTVEILDLKTEKLIASVVTGAAQGVALDRDNYYFGLRLDKRIVVVSAKTLKVTGEIKVPGSVLAMAYDEQNRRLYVDQDHGKKVWVVDPSTKRLVATIELNGEPSFVLYDKATNRVYQSVKTMSRVAVINPTTNKVETYWSTMPARGPHALALDSTAARLFTAGGNGRVVSLNLKTGDVEATVNIAKHADLIAFDPVAKNICCPGPGFLVLLKATDGGLRQVKEIPIPDKVYSIALDPVTHAAWLSFYDDAHSYLQKIDLP